MPSQEKPAVRAETRRAERALRALLVSGRRLVERGDGWAVTVRDRRCRPVVMLSDAEARDLIASGGVMAAEGGGYVRRERRGQDAWAPEFPEAALVVGLARPPRGRGVGFAGLAVKAGRGEGPLSARAAAAGLRLQKDAELAARRSGMTMDWEATPSDDNARGPSRGGLGAATAAAGRVGRLRARVGEAGFKLAWAACVEGVQLSALEVRFGLARRSGGERLGAALEKVAEGYDQVG